MSYSLSSIRVEDQSAVGAQLMEAGAAYLESSVGDSPQREAIIDHLKAACMIAQAMVDELGPTNLPVLVSVSGHANVDHQSDPGWAEECMTISVTLCKD